MRPVITLPMPFVVFEGLDGSGKSSLLNAFEAELKNKGISYVRTREPGGTALGEEVRHLILRHSTVPPTPRTELLLYQASRAQHVDLLIRPHLEKGDWVLCDRFTASSLAFQGAARGISYQEVVSLNRFATNGLQPELTVLLDLSVEAAKLRRSGRQAESGEQQDRIEAEADHFHEKVRQSFLQQATMDPGKWLVLDAQAKTQDMFQLLIKKCQEIGWLG